MSFFRQIKLETVTGYLLKKSRPVYLLGYDATLLNMKVKMAFAEGNVDLFQVHVIFTDWFKKSQGCPEKCERCEKMNPTLRKI